MVRGDKHKEIYRQLDELNAKWDAEGLSREEIEKRTKEFLRNNGMT